VSLLPPIDHRPEGNEPVHHEVRKALALEAGRRVPHDPFPSERTIAHEYGINRLTARKAIDALVLAGILYRVVRRGTFVSPRKDRTRRIALVCARPSQNSHPPCPHEALCASIREGATSLRHEVTPILLAHAPMEDLRDRLIKLRPDATLICHPDPQYDLGTLKQAGSALLRVGVWLPPGDTDMVAADSFSAAALACQYLSRLGHGRIGIVGRSTVDGRAPSPSIPLFCAGCETASLQYRFVFSPDGRVFSDDKRERCRLLNALLQGPDPPTAFVALDRQLAGEVLACMRGSRTASGSSVEVVAIEALPNGNVSSSVPAVIVDLREVGRLALRIALMNEAEIERPPYTFLANATLRTGPGEGKPAR